MKSTEFKERFAALLVRVDLREIDVVADIESAIEDDAHDVVTRCFLRCLRAFALARRGNHAEAAEDLNVLLPFATREGLHAVVTQCHRVLSECANARGDQLANRQHCVSALAASRLCDDEVLRFACELRIANVIGEWGHATHAAMLTRHLYENTDWSHRDNRDFRETLRCTLGWWLIRSGDPKAALRHLYELEESAQSPFRRHLAATCVAFALHSLGEPIEIVALEALLVEALEHGWHAAAAEIHLLLSHQEPDDSPFARTNVTLALGLRNHCSVELRLLVLDRALVCAASRGDDEAEAVLDGKRRAHLDAIARAEAIAPLVCPLLNQRVVGALTQPRALH